MADPFRELNPRKGTENHKKYASDIILRLLSANLIPARGLKKRFCIVVKSGYSFRELNPRKGTENFE